MHRRVCIEVSRRRIEASQTQTATPPATTLTLTTTITITNIALARARAEVIKRCTRVVLRRVRVNAAGKRAGAVIKSVKRRVIRSLAISTPG